MKYDICSGYICAEIHPSFPDKPSTAPYCTPHSVTPKVKSQLSDAKLVFLGGRGLGNRQNYNKMKALASKYGAVCACTRPVAMNGWESYDNFVGVSGHCLTGCTVVAFGVSGAGPLISGIENANTIIAVNNDPNALIFDFAHYGIVDDCIKIIDEMILL